MCSDIYVSETVSIKAPPRTLNLQAEMFSVLSFIHRCSEEVSGAERRAVKTADSSPGWPLSAVQPELESGTRGSSLIINNYICIIVAISASRSPK